MDFDSRELSSENCYRLLTGAVVPRPIAWVMTLGPTGVVNLAPFSFFNLIASRETRPPMLMVSIGPKPDGVKKDSVRNIEARGEFVVHVVTEDLAEAMVQTSFDYPSEVSEAEAVGLKVLPGHAVAVPHLEAAPIHLECKLVQLLELGEPPTALAIGEVLRISVRDEVLRDGRIDPERLRPVARLSGITYGRVRELFQMKPRPA